MVASAGWPSGKLISNQPLKPHRMFDAVWGCEAQKPGCFTGQISQADVFAPSYLAPIA